MARKKPIKTKKKSNPTGRDAASKRLVKKRQTNTVRGRVTGDISIQQIMEYAPIAFIAIDKNNIVQFANSRAGDLSGYDRKKLIGMDVDTLIPERFRKTYRKKAKGFFVKSQKRELGVVLDFFCLRRDGTELPVEIRLDPLEVDGRPHILASLLDVSRKKQAEEALRESEERFRSLSEAAFEGLMIHDRGIILTANQKFAELFGFKSPAELIGQNGLEILPLTPKSRDYLKASIGKHSSLGGEVEVVRKDGSTYPAETQARNIIYKGKPVRVVAMRDISARKMAQEALHKAEIKYRTLVEQIPPIVYTANPHQHIGVTYISPQIETLGFTAEEVISDPDLWFRQIHPDDQARVKEDIERAARGNKAFRSEYRFITRDGNIRWLLDEAMDAVDANGNILIRQGYMLDITERKVIEDALRESEHRYRELYEIEQSHARELTLLDKVRSTTAHELDLDKLIPQIVTSISETFGYTNVNIYILDGEELILRHHVGYSQTIERLSFTKGICGRVARTGQPALVEDVTKDPDFLEAMEGTVSQISVPLFDGNKVAGVMNLESGPGAVLTEADLKLMTALSEYVSVAIGRARLFGDVDKQNKYLALLNEYTSAILLSSDLDTILHDLAGNMTALTNADDCYITLWDEERQLTLPRATTALLEKPYNSVGESSEPNLTASVLKAGRALAVEDVFNSPYISSEIANRYPARSVVGVPLIAQEHKLGAAIIAFNSPHRFTPEEIQRAEYAASHIAAAVWSAKQDIEIKKRLKEQETLARITSALSQTEHIGLSNLLKLIADSSRELITNAEQAVIHLVDEEKTSLIPKAVSGIERSEAGQFKMRIGEGAAGQAVTGRQSIYISDVEKDNRFINLNPAVKYRSLLVTPVVGGDQTLGTISIQSKKRHAFTKNDASLLSGLAQQAAIAIENTRLLESIQQKLQETNALYLISRGLLALNADELLENVVDLLEIKFGYHLVLVYVIDPDSKDFVLRAASGEKGKWLLKAGHRLKAGSGIIGHVAETREPFFTNNVDEVIFHIDNPLNMETKSEMAIPIQAGDRLLGILDIQQTETITFTQHDLQLVTIVADQLAASLQKADLYESLQKSLQQEKAMRNQLIQTERLAIMGRLLASVSHELNNPLQAIQNALFLLKEDKGISPQGMNDLEIVLAESERMAGMIERLRDTYRPTQAEDLRPTHLNDIIEDVLALISTHLKKNNIAYNFNADPDMPVITAQPDQIRQVTLNLLMNAVEAMTEEGILSVTTEYLRDSGEALVCVSDTGVGIPPALLPMIFDPFITNKKRGTGIGLTISHDIVMKHGGRISAENNPDGRGATFKVWLPVRSDSVEAK